MAARLHRADVAQAHTGGELGKAQLVSVAKLLPSSVGAPPSQLGPVFCNTEPRRRPLTATPDDVFIGALPDLLDRYQPRRAMITRAPGRLAAYRALRQKLIDQHIEIVDAGMLPAADLGGGISLKVLAGDVDTGSVPQLEWDRFALVMAPGLDAAGETTLINDGLAQPATALLLANSGSSQSTSEAWVRALNPQLGLISVGAGNTDGNPAIEVLARLAGRAQDYSICRGETSG